ncbi:MAG: hypothetical protein KU29_07530 [Sulfurovum sp. FS06-10]|nr:MAG: hypothetical protein KU29_07530 [Sulfurovum sp. FS06-10]
MSIQDTLNEAKKELSSDEQILVSAFKLEKLYKKHKIKLFSIIAIVALYFGGTAIMNSIQHQKLVVANSAYLTLLKDANNTQALADLQSNNPKLFELYTYQKAMNNLDTTALKELASSKNEIIADLSAYDLAIIEGKPAKSEYLEDVALVNNAYLLIKEGKMKEAKEQLDMINEESPVFNIAKIIKHYTIKGQ